MNDWLFFLKKIKFKNLLQSSVVVVVVDDYPFHESMWLSMATDIFFHDNDHYDHDDDDEVNGY